MIHTNRQDLREQCKQESTAADLSRSYSRNRDFFKESNCSVSLNTSPWFFCLFCCTDQLQTVYCERKMYQLVVVYWGGRAKAAFFRLLSRAVVSALRAHKATRGARLLFLPSFQPGLCVLQEILWKEIVQITIGRKEDRKYGSCQKSNLKKESSLS